MIERRNNASAIEPVHQITDGDNANAVLYKDGDTSASGAMK